MIRRSFLLEKDSELRLLPATPRRWLQPGEEIVVRDAAPYFANLDLKVKSRADQGNIAVELVLRNDRPDQIRKIRLRLPHPDKQPMKQVMVNGTVSKKFDAEHEAVEPKPLENQCGKMIRCFSPARSFLARNLSHSLTAPSTLQPLLTVLPSANASRSFSSVLALDRAFDQLRASALHLLW